MLKLLKLNANEAIRSGATATSSSGSVIRRNTCQAPAAVDARRLDELPGNRLERPERDEEEVGEAPATG